MKAIDLGGPMRIVVEDFNYGMDELFYQDAANAGVLLAMEDGTDDGDETIDTYLIPTWGTETVLDVLARYFPHTTDDDGNLIAIWTPDTAPTRRPGAPSRNVGIGQPADAVVQARPLHRRLVERLHERPGRRHRGLPGHAGRAGQTALFRFNQDSDLDGYTDRSEERLGTDPNDPASYPKPELLAGVHSIRSGNNVTATLSLLNTGVYDAYGVEAVMIAPNDTISHHQQHRGRLGPGAGAEAGDRGQPHRAADAAARAWLAAGHAQPCRRRLLHRHERPHLHLHRAVRRPGGCAWAPARWTPELERRRGRQRHAQLRRGYNSPTLLDVGAYGVKLGLLSGTVNNGESFTVAANTPRDTFQYTIAAGHESDFTPPVVLVSYNDPQGNHRFVIPPAAMAWPARPTT